MPLLNPIRKKDAGAKVKKAWLVIKKPDTMPRTNRDLLVLLKQEVMTAQAIEQQVTFLHDLLFQVEKSTWVTAAHEIININNSRISSKKSAIKKALKTSELKPFIFLNNLN